MTFTIKRIARGDEPTFIAIAPDVFDEPIDAARLDAYLSDPGHLMVLAIEAGTVVGQCGRRIHRHPDKPDELYIDEAGTASTQLRQGVATALMGEIFA